MNVDERTIGAELRAMAEAVSPVNAQALTARAVRGSRRRRLTWSLAGAAVAAACATGALVVVPGGGTGPTVAAPADGLPANTPAQLRLVRACMPKGGPVHEMDGNRRMPEQGDVRDFRVLVEYHDAVGSTALTGSLKGFVLCTPQKYPQFADRAVFHDWSNAKRGSLTVDYYETQTDSHTQRGEGDFQDDSFRVVAGRVTPEVARVEIDWADGRRGDAAVANGYFVGRVLGRVKDHHVLNTPPVTVTAYDKTGRVAGREKGVRFMDRTARGAGSGTN